MLALDIGNQHTAMIRTGARMKRFFFDIKDGHRLIDPTGMEFEDEAAAIARAEVIAVQVSLDTPAVDPTRHISVLNDSRTEIFKVPVYSKLDGTY